MSDIDTKLKEIQVKFQELRFELDDEAIAQIKHLFEQEGYHKYIGDKHGLLSGQEWYERFIEEVREMRRLEVPFSAKAVEAVARKAAGIE